MKVAICGGGTGGHLHPLLALAKELESRDGLEVTFYLSRKASSTAFAAEDRRIDLEVSGFSRDLSPGNLKAMVQLARAFALCRKDMKIVKPQVAVAFGGYASVPGAAAALSLGVPLILHEQNVIPGMANRLMAPFARKLAVSFPQTLERHVRWRRKAAVTGNPLRLPQAAPSEEDALEQFRLERGRKTLGVIGGSQGAASLNRAVLEALPAWRNRGDLQVVHSVGRDKYQEFQAQAAKVDTGRLLYRPVEFIERMDLLYELADLVVCRAGATTISELAAMGCAAVLVPYPYATAAHQDANAEVLGGAGAALVIRDQDLSGKRLTAEVDNLIDDEQRLKNMQEHSRRAGKPDASVRLADLVLAQC